MKRLSRKEFMGWMGAGAAAMALPARVRGARPEGRRPNFILIMADDLSANELSCYGNKENRTPLLDELARTGVMFRTCWATPVCGPSRAAIMTGRYGYRTGWYHNDMKPAAGDKGYNLAQDNLIFSQVLKKAGYVTGVCGKWQLRGTEKEYGFDETCMHHAIKGEFEGPVEPEEGSLPGRVARYWHPAIVANGKQVKTTENDYGDDVYADFILDFAKRHKDEPFLFYFPMSLIHITWDFDNNRMGYVAPPELDNNGNKTGRKGQPTKKGNVEYMDHIVGRLAKGLETLGLRDNTAILFTGDNGTAGYGKGQLAEERGPRVPMIVNCPGFVKPLGPCDAIVSFADVLPTLAEMGGGELPKDYEIDGRSFAPVLRGEKKQTREWIFSNYADKRWLRDTRWLLDGNGRFFDCGDRRDETGYKDGADSKDPEAVAARRRFEEILKGMPAPAPDDPTVKRYEEKNKAQKERRAKSHQLWQEKYGGDGPKQKKGKGGKKPKAEAG